MPRNKDLSDRQCIEQGCRKKAIISRKKCFEHHREMIQNNRRKYWERVLSK